MEATEGFVAMFQRTIPRLRPSFLKLLNFDFLREKERKRGRGAKGERERERERERENLKQAPHSVESPTQGLISQL